MSAISGLHFQRAVAYAIKACPDDEARARLAHVVFIQNKIIGADGERWHVGLLPDEAAIEKPIAVSRRSVADLLLGLEYARRMSKTRAGVFEVHQHENVVTIKFGDEKIKHKLDLVDVGDIAPVWDEPVPPNAPELKGSESELRCGHMKSAMEWYKAWDTDHGAFTMHGFGGGRPVRMDIIASGDLVAQAFVLPSDHPQAQLPDNEPLLAGARGGKHSQAITALKLVGAQDPPPPKPEQAPVRKRRKKAEAEAPNGVE